MKSWSGSQLGGTLFGIAAVISAVGGLYYNMRTGAAQQDEALAPAQRFSVDGGHGSSFNSGTSSTGISLLEVEVAETAMKKGRKVAYARKCHEFQPETWDRGELTYGKAQAAQAAGHYGDAEVRFREATAYYSQCTQV